ncbi:MAG: hypothetical protein C3F12_14090 [Candidatus Methylomirabilota bacterium]|nr:DUF2779 domain-containing protein [candidate division NC10 bacterium]PWB43025.1 MAG: hypothetical protein C3F12_14090 [candidate division NC10 bacterium]
MKMSESARPVGLSKSRIMAGLQCHKRLWWTVHEPAAPELQPDEIVKAAMDRGARVTEIARTVVAYNAGFERGVIEQMAETM